MWLSSSHLSLGDNVTKGHGYEIVPFDALDVIYKTKMGY